MQTIPPKNLSHHYLSARRKSQRSDADHAEPPSNDTGEKQEKKKKNHRRFEGIMRPFLTWED